VRKNSVLAPFGVAVAFVAVAAYGSSSAALQADHPGKAPYEANCRKCHGVRGVPPKTMKAKYEKIPTFDANFFAKHSQDSIVTVLTKGKGEDMKSFKAKLTHEEMENVAKYIKSFVPEK
jgi:mono/diheme cytochrome c family protein